ncbi:unnamed protein product [Bursaphelenchus xylophilus]|uniref:(pine wood nematode) hypothetical protein n=1 Tax=Bursaphelenchus xylophilus TaxID=6326 RepID=A0A1I7RV31_BURXY|nr:unnamed protein product [Bursaphelenchus xylophilus]CAG9105163.1 unnamed protein product [Bursaphelenchus xylophilus]
MLGNSTLQFLTTPDEKMNLIKLIAPFEPAFAASHSSMVEYKGEQRCVNPRLKSEWWGEILRDFTRIHPRLEGIQIRHLRNIWRRLKQMAQKNIEEERDLTKLDIATLSVKDPNALRAQGLEPMEFDPDFGANFVPDPNARIPTAAEVFRESMKDDYFAIARQRRKERRAETHRKKNQEAQLSEDEEAELDESGSGGSAVDEPSTSEPPKKRGKYKKRRNYDILGNPTENHIVKVKLSTQFMEYALKAAKLEDYARRNWRKIVFQPTGGVSVRDPKVGEDLSINFPPFLPEKP